MRYKCCVCVCARAHAHARLFSHVRLFVTPWTVARQAPLSTGFSRQEYWSGLPFPPPAGIHNSGINAVVNSKKHFDMLHWPGLVDWTPAIILSTKLWKLSQFLPELVLSVSMDHSLSHCDTCMMRTWAVHSLWIQWTHDLLFPGTAVATKPSHRVLFTVLCNQRTI